MPTIIENDILWPIKKKVAEHLVEKSVLLQCTESAHRGMLPSDRPVYHLSAGAKGLSIEQLYNIIAEAEEELGNGSDQSDSG